ncbi:MAG TPA: sulfotransferase [Steroidobacteraceae bacterium]|nr:sulfotransferase [Steroidobacteraceae bacterium]
MIFLAGFARSGTTWVSSVIDSHPDVLYRHEFFGRRFALLGDQLFRKLKFDSGLSDEDYITAVGILAGADVQTDKPPFFSKRFRSLGRPSIQKVAWLVARTMPVLSRAYARFFTPRDCQDVALVVKETGAAIWLESFMAGMRADKLIVLVRHPYAVIASHVVGSRAGLLQTAGDNYRRSWFMHHSTRAKYLQGIEWERVADMPEVEYLALSWRVQNEEYLRLCASFPRSKIMLYEAFVSSPISETTDMLQFLNLTPDEQVFGFLEASTSGKASVYARLGNASSEYYNVYRGKGFDPEKWTRTLSDDDLKLIDTHTAALVGELGLDRWMSRGSPSVGPQSGPVSDPVTSERLT